jgi:myo-inositol 2-dehydrogenase / D-chiro-inositol 1-dehydrogenase
MSVERLRIGVIGAGRIGRVHAEALTTRVPQAQVRVISDPVLESATTASRTFGIPDAVADHRDILARGDIDAVVICSPTDTHSQIICEAAAAGKHVFTEKPIDHDLGKIHAALAAVQKAKVTFQVGFNRRFDPNFERVAEQIREGRIGTPQLVRITSRDPSPPPLSYIKVSGGIFLDMTIHDFDMARFVIGDEVEEVFATGGALVDKAIGAAGDLDTAVVVLKYRGGAICTIDNCRQAVYGYDQRLEVLGTQGALLAENNTPTRTALWTKQSLQTPGPLHFFLERYMDSYVAEMRAFVRSVQEGSAPRVSGADGLQAVLLGLAATRSAREGRPVRMSELHPATGAAA